MKTKVMKCSIIPVWAFLAFVPLAALGKPNIILILADDWGYGDIAVQGRGKPAPYTPNGIQEALMTPSLDQMAAEGTRYTQFYQNAAHRRTS